MEEYPFMLMALQVFSAWILTLFGISKLLRASDDLERLVGSILAAIGLTFFSLLLFRIKRTRI